VLGALLGSAAVRRGPRFTAAWVVATAAVGILELLYFRLAIAPRLHPSLVEYWEGAYVPDISFAAAVRYVWDRPRTQLTAAWGAGPAVAAFVCLGAATLHGRVRRSAGLAVVLLVLELAILSARRTVPFNEPRVTMFLLT